MSDRRRSSCIANIISACDRRGQLTRTICRRFSSSQQQLVITTEREQGLPGKC